ncbi:MAG: ribonuclease H-like domain-containing protein [Chloroflexi bacterium]|nr:ribonuclease H-like domain-containing protein [Chloroflexota bacterium]
MDLSERLRRLQRLGLHKGTSKLRPPAPPPAGPGIEAVVDGEWISTPHGHCFVSETTYPLDEWRGGLPLGECLTLPPAALAACARDPALAELDWRTAAFVDTETSGLAGGTGTFVFLLGVGTFDDQGFTVRQLFMPSPAEEGALLHAAAGILDRCTGLVSYNGRAFDLPLLNTRFILNRQLPRLQDAPHLDLLFPARRLWRARLGSCTLGNVEQQALGVLRQEADVPGWLIPTLYREYLRSGDASELRRVFYHNLEDILSLVTLAARLCRLFVPDGIPTLDELPPVDRFSLGRAYEELGWAAASEDAYRQALAAALPPDVRERALQQLSFLLKRQGRREEAAHLWRRWSAEALDGQLTPFVELAKHHEWHVTNLPAALAWTQEALQRAETWPPSPGRSLALAELQHRLNRLQDKLVKSSEA